MLRFIVQLILRSLTIEVPRESRVRSSIQLLLFFIIYGFVLPNVSRRFGLHSLSDLAAVKWYSAPPDIRNVTSLHALRIQLSTWLGYPVRRRIGL